MVRIRNEEALAFITAIGLGANRPQAAVYPTSDVDSDAPTFLNLDTSGRAASENSITR